MATKHEPPAALVVAVETDKDLMDSSPPCNIEHAATPEPAPTRSNRSMEVVADPDGACYVSSPLQGQNGGMTQDVCVAVQAGTRNGNKRHALAVFPKGFKLGRGGPRTLKPYFVCADGVSRTGKEFEQLVGLPKTGEWGKTVKVFVSRDGLSVKYIPLSQWLQGWISSTPEERATQAARRNEEAAWQKRHPESAPQEVVSPCDESAVPAPSDSAEEREQLATARKAYTELCNGGADDAGVAKGVRAALPVHSTLIGGKQLSEARIGEVVELLRVLEHCLEHATSDFCGEHILNGIQTCSENTMEGFNDGVNNLHDVARVAFALEEDNPFKPVMQHMSTVLSTALVNTAVKELSALLKATDDNIDESSDFE